MYSNLFSHVTSCHSTQYEAAYKDRHPEINSREIFEIFTAAAMMHNDFGFGSGKLF